jgi:hypothetical protein
MSQRFISNVALAVAGAVVVVSTQAFASQTSGRVTFGVCLGALALLAMAQRDRAGERIEWMLDAEIARAARAVVGGRLSGLQRVDPEVAVARRGARIRRARGRGLDRPRGEDRACRAFARVRSQRLGRARRAPGCRLSRRPRRDEGEHRMTDPC